MEDLANLAIGLGLVISLAFSELFGLTAAGLVVPGYVALHLNHPAAVVLTLAASYLTYFVVHTLGTVTIVYGRRRTVLMILFGFLIGGLFRAIGPIELGAYGVELSLIGHIIPGLIAIWIDRQGLLESVSALIVASVIVRLGLILVTGGDLTL